MLVTFHSSLTVCIHIGTGLFGLARVYYSIIYIIQWKSSNIRDPYFNFNFLLVSIITLINFH